MEKVLVLGASGLVGRSIIRELPQAGGFQIYGTYLNNPIALEEGRSIRLSVDDTEGLKDILSNIKPDRVISCTRGDFSKQLEFHKQLSEWVAKNGGVVYFFSTGNVFDGDLSRPGYENTPVNSITDYGKYKIECEELLKKTLGENAIILRIPEVWGKSCPRISILKDKLSKGEQITEYPLLLASNITDVMIAKKLRYIIENELKGTFHLCSEDTISHMAFRKELLNRLGLSNDIFIEDTSEKGYFAVLTNRSGVFPEELKVTNQDILDYLSR